MDDVTSRWASAALFRIDMWSVTNKDLLSIRRYLPRHTYRLIKNRRVARLYRQKKAEEKQQIEQAHKSLGDRINTLEDDIERELNTVARLKHQHLENQRRISELEDKLSLEAPCTRWCKAVQCSTTTRERPHFDIK